MTFWEALTVAGLVSTIMGVFLTVYGIVNNRTLKEESRNTREILLHIENGQQEARKEVAATVREIAQAISESRREMAEAIKQVAELIRVEGQAAREAMRRT